MCIYASLSPLLSNTTNHYNDDGGTLMNNEARQRLLRFWISGLMIGSWILCLCSVDFPYDHVLGYYPIIMYVGYGLMLAFALVALLMIILKKNVLADIFPLLAQVTYFIMFGILFILRLQRGYVLSFPLLMISLFVMAILALLAAVFLVFKRNRQGYLFSIIAYSCLTMAAIIESYPVAYDAVSETYGYIKLVYFFAIIAAGILGIVHSAKKLKQIKKENHR